jgi:hypothetical protein
MSACAQCGGPEARIGTYAGIICEKCHAILPKRCDFCDQQPKWRYPVHPYVVDVKDLWPTLPSHPIRSAADWLACDTCKDLIEANENKDLAQRAAKFFKSTYDEAGFSEPNLSSFLLKLHQKFRDHCYGKPYPFGEKPPVRIPARADYMIPIETRAAWLRWAKSGALHWDYQLSPLDNREVLLRFMRLLERGDTFYMDGHFCRLVDEARQNMPDDIKFEAAWMIQPYGFLWIQEPFDAPSWGQVAGVQESKVVAVGWERVEQKSADVKFGQEYWFGLFQRDGGGCFAPCAYFKIYDTEALNLNVHRFGEGSQEMNYAKTPEVRWIYAAMHMMSGKLAAKPRPAIAIQRSTRKRLERLQVAAPPFVEVIMLRRFQQQRQELAIGKVRQFTKWQWDVAHHWRDQCYYPAHHAEGTCEHKPTYIESYRKGLLGRPMKPGSSKLYVASR